MTIIMIMIINNNTLHDTLKLLNLRPGLYILMQKAVILKSRNVSTVS
jgi:hypothetical protein